MMQLTPEQVIEPRQPQPNGLTSGWTEERVERLIALQGEMLSASEIAAALGGVSRNAVIGKLTRLGFAPGRKIGMAIQRRLRESKPRRPPCERKSGLNFERLKRLTTSAPDRQVKNDRQRRAQDLAAHFEAVEIVDLPPEQSTTAVRLMGLTANNCRWPLGDPRDLDAMRFCGTERHRSYPYCARHCMVAYRLPARGAHA